MKQIVKYSTLEDEILGLLADAIHESELKYSCKDLVNAGVDNEQEMGRAILKSMQVLQQVGLIPKRHFKHLFVTKIETGEIYNDWRMSKMGFLLVIMHVSGNSPMLNKIKIEMVKMIN